MRTPLAWKNLTHDRRRLALAVGGVGFAVLLMFMQLGFRGALFDSTVGLIERFDADIVVVHSQRYMLSIMERFPRRYLQLAESTPNIASAAPLYFEKLQSTWKRANEPVGSPIRVLAFDPNQPPLLIDEVLAQAHRLDPPDTALYDRRSSKDFGPIQIGDEVELAGHRIHIVGEYELGTDFADDGNIVVSDKTYAAVFPSAPGTEILDSVDYGMIKIRPGSDLEATRTAVDDLLPDDVRVLTKQQYIDYEQGFWGAETPIGYIFAFGTAMGLIVGTVICYQILSTDVSDHLREFATLKAMGYQSQYFVSVVLQESLILSFLGFIPGIVIAWALYDFVGNTTGLPMVFTGARIVLIFCLTITMCVVSGCMTMRKVVTTDPAELF